MFQEGSTLNQVRTGLTSKIFRNIAAKCFNTAEKRADCACLQAMKTISGMTSPWNEWEWHVLLRIWVSRKFFINIRV